METKVSNYGIDYNTGQLFLPLDLATIIDPNDPVFDFLDVMKGVDLTKYFKRKEPRGRKGYNKVELLMAVIYCAMKGIYSTRGIRDECKSRTSLMYILKEERPSHQAIEDLKTKYLVKSIDEIFFELNDKLCDLMDVNKDIQYIDGTKLESAAGKYTFVYKARIINERKKLFEKITESIISMNFEAGYDFKYGYFYCAQEIGYIVQYLMELMLSMKIEFVYGRGKRKSGIQRWYDQFITYYKRLLEYEYWLDVISEERNSCSKTDHDATMCATKMDYYCNTGLSRPCYNAQIAVSDGLIVNADLYQRPGDTKTFIPFMERYKEYTGEYPKQPMADAAYGSYDNYMFCIENGMDLYMKYGLYAKKNEPKFKKNKFNTLNWETDENGNKICPNGLVFNQYTGETYEEDGEYLKVKQLYTSEGDCINCPLKKSCRKSSRSDRRVLSRNVILDEFYATVDDNLSTEHGKELKKQRSIQAEGAFGVLKQDMKFTRFSSKGLSHVKTDFLIVCLAYNMNKYHHYRQKQKKKSLIN